MRKLRFTHKLKVQKFKGLLDSDQRGTSLEKIRINGAKERQRYLKAAYEAETFDKPKNVLGITRSLPAKEMERLIYAQIKVSDEDLRLLARRRAQAVKDLFVASRKVAAKRLFVLEPRVISSGKKARRTTTGVELTIK